MPGFNTWVPRYTPFSQPLETMKHFRKYVPSPNDAAAVATGVAGVGAAWYKAKQRESAYADQVKSKLAPLTAKKQGPHHKRPRKKKLYVPRAHRTHRKVYQRRRRQNNECCCCCHQN